MTRQLVKRLGLAGIATVAGLGLAEIGARVVLHNADEAAFRKYASFEQLEAKYGQYSRFEVHRHLGFALTPDFGSGVDRHNAHGFRGEQFELEKAEGTTRIVCAGGSTTYGFGVLRNHTKSYPHIAGETLRQAGVAAEVINAGCPGWTSLETLINFQTRVVDLAPDILVVYHGINDVLARMVAPASAYRGDLSGWLDRHNALRDRPLWESSTLARYILVRSGSVSPHGDMRRIIGDVPPTSLAFRFRNQRLRGVYPRGVFLEHPIENVLTSNPPRYFERNLRALVALAERERVHVVLTTFAFSTEFPNKAYIGHPAVQRAILDTNEVVRTIAAETTATLHDLERQLPKDDRSLFTDGEHFTAKGNRERAHHMIVHLHDTYGLGRK